MKVDVDKINAGTAPLRESAGQKPSSKPVADAPAAQGVMRDSLQLSGLSSRLKEIESKLSQGAGFDAGRVAEIKQAISKGKFSVNTEVVADRVIASAYEALVKRH